MRWVAPAKVTIAGTTVQAGAVVNVSSFSDEEILELVYLGKIVPDTGVGANAGTKTISGDGGSWNLPKSGDEVQQGARGTFVAPFSGVVLIISTVSARPDPSGGTVQCWVRVRRGATVGSGASAGSTRASIHTDSRLSTENIVMPITDLVPGATYNAVHAFSSTNGAVVSLPSIVIVPQQG